MTSSFFFCWNEERKKKSFFRCLYTINCKSPHLLDLVIVDKNRVRVKSPHCVLCVRGGVLLLARSSQWRHVDGDEWNLFHRADAANSTHGVVDWVICDFFTHFVWGARSSLESHFELAVRDVRWTCRMGALENYEKKPTDSSALVGNLVRHPTTSKAIESPTRVNRSYV